MKALYVDEENDYAITEDDTGQMFVGPRRPHVVRRDNRFAEGLVTALLVEFNLALLVWCVYRMVKGL